MTITLRTTTLADLDAVEAVLKRSYPSLLKADYPPSVLVTAVPIMIRAQPKLLTCGSFFVAEEDEVVLGVGGWTRDKNDFQLGHIRHVGTDDRHLRRGIARKLLAHCFDTARASGVTRMECWSTLTAESFYQSMGFRTLGPKTVMLDQAIPFESLQMVRSL